MMPANFSLLDQIEDRSSAPIVARLLYLASLADSEADFLGRALPDILESSGGGYVALVAPVSGHWSSLADAGTFRALPRELLADVADRQEIQQEEEWHAVPLSLSGESSELLVVHAASSSTAIGAWGIGLGVSLEEIRRWAQARRRLRRLEMILGIAQQWNQTNEMEPLLIQIAEAATQLQSADRASIFLWDRPNKTLVGRPALGVEGGELRITDDTGIVGQVVHTGQPYRVGSGDQGAPIARNIDQQLNYKTETLLCVPLMARSGQVLGAFEVLNKQEGDFSDEDQRELVELAGHAAIALENTLQFEDLLITHRQIVDQAAEGVQLIGESAAVEALRSTVERVADTDLAILVLGENGTGKEVVSRSVHYLSRRRNQPFIAVNCAALAETLLESELFGHEKGAFTDAHEARPGKFELATGGTLLLDEIGELSLGGQAKLLRVLEEKLVIRVGGSTPIHTDVRVLAATNQNLADMVASKRFREDLYYRLNVVTLELPPLRKRGDDVVFLAEHFLKEFCQKARRKLPKISAAARKRLLAHPWPGNVRELRNLMERLAFLLPADRIEADDLAFILSPSGSTSPLIDADLPLSEATRQFQCDYIQEAIKIAGGNMSDAAEKLGLHRSNLYRKMRQLGTIQMTNDEIPNDE